jgi:hypothetical protein
VIVDDPAGVDAEVVRVNVDEHVGLHNPGENAAVAPVGRPEAEKDTDCDVPETSVAVIVFDPDCPWTTVWFPPLEREKLKEGVGAFTVNVNIVVWDREPATPVTVIVDDPAGVDAEVVRVNVDEHAGLHDPGENAAVAPAGRPEAENDTDCEVPETNVAVIVLDADCPWMTLLFPPLESEKSKEGGGAFTVKVKVVVWDKEPATPVTVIVDDPVGVDAEVVRVNVDEHVGLQDPGGEKEAVAPAGRPEAENETDCEVPDTRAAVIVLDTDCPWTTVWFPPLEREKSKEGGGMELAALNAAMPAAQTSEAPSDALAQAVPAVACIAFSTMSFVFGSAGTVSSIV